MIAHSSRLRLAVFGTAIVALLLLAYSNSLLAPMELDDMASIRDNVSIRSLRSALFPPNTAGVGGRPILNLSFALNYAIGGADVRYFHVVNLFIHAASAIVLFALVRQTLLRQSFCFQSGAVAGEFGAAVAGLWALHPVQTESVSYVSQRAESLMGLFFFLTLYCFVRGAETREKSFWPILSVGACAAGMATKEVMISAPLIVLLYDRTFLSGSFSSAWHRHRNLYLALAATWALLALLILTSQLQIRGIGVGRGYSAWNYLLVESTAIGRYLRLAFWPSDLIFDYGQEVSAPLEWATVVSFSTECFLLVLVIAALRYRPALGFLGVWFFAILAPTSSVVPVALQPIAENRLYLPLVAPVALAMGFAHAWIGRKFVFAALAIAPLFGWTTWLRNHDYRSELALWKDTVTKAPGSSRAQNNVGHALMQLGQADAALVYYEAALRINPDYPEARSNLGAALAALGRFNEAIRECEKALKQIPNLPHAHYTIGYSLLGLGRPADALVEISAALEIQPEFPKAHYSAGCALLALGRPAEAIAHLQTALRLQPEYPDAENNLGAAFYKLGRPLEAVPHFEAALRSRANDPEIHQNLAGALLQAKQPLAAIDHYNEALRLNPNSPGTHVNFGLALAIVDRRADAIAEFEQALRLDPNSAKAHYHLGYNLLTGGRIPESISHLETVLRLQPDYPDAENNLASAYYRAGRIAEAVPHFQAAVRLRPSDSDLRQNLASALLQSHRLDEAIENYDIALRLNPNSALAHSNLALALEQSGRFSEAIAHYEKVLQLEPTNLAARENIARLRSATSSKTPPPN